MNKFLFAVAFVLFFLGGCKGGGEEKRAGENPAALTIVAMGDSLTAGLGVAEEEAYPAQLQAKLRRAGYAVRVVNAGVSGETSSGALARLDWLLALRPAIVIVETGGNDGLRGLPPALVAHNLDQIVARLQDAGAVVVLAGMKIHRNMGAEYTQAFAAIYPEVAKRRGVIYVPFFLEGVAGQARLLQADAIHPKAEGYRLVVETLYPAVEEALRQVQKKHGIGRQEPLAANPMLLCLRGGGMEKT